MSQFHRSGRVNIKALVILVLVVVFLGCGAVIARHVRKRVIAERALAAGKAALEREDWVEATRELRRYLVRYPDDEEMLRRYVEANLAIRPVKAENVGTAIAEYRRLLRKHPGDAHLCHELAKLYVSIGDFAEAAYVCQQRLEADASDSVAMFWLGRARVAQGQLAEARQVLERLVDAHPEEVKAYGLLAGMAAQEDSPTAKESAQSWLDLAVSANPESAEARLQRARFYRTVGGDRDGAGADLDGAEAHGTSDATVWLGLAAEWLALGEAERADAALEALDQAGWEARDLFGTGSEAFALTKFEVAGQVALIRGHREKGIQLADQAIKTLPEGQREAYLPLVVQLYLAGDRVAEARAAVEAYRERTAVRHGIDAVVGEHLALLDAAVAQAEGRPYAVIETLQDMVVLHPQRAAGWRLLWKAYEETGQLDRAEPALEAYSAGQPNDAEALLALARAYRYRDWGKVLTYARRAERVRPDEPDAALLRMEATLFGGGEEPGDAELAAVSDELAALDARYPQKAAVGLLRAVVAQRQGRVDEAVDLLERAIRDSDNPLAASLQLADWYARENRMDDGLSVCRAAVERHRNQAAPRIALAQLQVNAGQADAARETLTRAVDDLQGQERTASVYALVRYELWHGDRDQAVERLKRLAVEEPDAARPRLELLASPEVQRDRETVQRLIDELRRIEGEGGLRWRMEQINHWVRSGEWSARQDTIEDMLERVAELDPRSVTAHLYLIRLARQRGDANEAANRVDRALGANPRDERLTLVRASMEAEAGRVPAARALVRSVLEVSPNHAGARIMLAELAYRSGDFAEARATAEKAVELDPTGEAAHEIYAKALAAQGEPRRAIELLDTYRRTDAGRDSIMAPMLLAALYRAEGDWTAAGERLDEAAALAPDDRAVFIERMRWLAGQGRFDDLLGGLAAWRTAHTPDATILIEAGGLLTNSPNADHWRDARRLLTEAVALNPTVVDGHLALARAAYRLGERSAAVGAYRQVLSVQPDHRDALNDLAWMLGVELGQPLEALSFADQGVARYPGDAHLLDTRGVLLHRLERLDEARRDLEACLIAAVDLPGTRVRALLHLAQVHISQGQPAAARGRLEEAAAMDAAHHGLSSEERAELEQLQASLTP